MDQAALKTLQTPLKERYRSEPQAALLQTIAVPPRLSATLSDA